MESDGDDMNSSDNATVLDEPSSTPEALTRWYSIFNVALPSSILNVAAPLLATLQTALIGHKAGVTSLAAYGSVWTCLGLCIRLNTYLVDGVSAKTGASIGSRNWSKLAMNVKRSLSFAFVMGISSVIILISIRGFLFGQVLHLDQATFVEACRYWQLVVYRVVFVLLSMSISGVLQGFRHGSAVAWINSISSLVEIGLDFLFVSLYPTRALFCLGVIALVCSSIQTIVGLVLLFKLTPPEFDGGTDEFSLYDRLISGGDSEDDGGSGDSGEESLISFLMAGCDMFLRSLIMQATFFIALICVSRMESSAVLLAAHSIVSNIWLLVSYIVDGFAAAAIVLGSRLRGMESESSALYLVTLTRRVLVAGFAAGVMTSVALAVCPDFFIGFFTKDRAVSDVLISCWWLLCLVQPLNGLVFTIDGLLYAGQQFRFIRNYFIAGFTLVFVPAIVLYGKYSLLGVWTTKAVFNVYRLAGGALWVWREVSTV
jgi:Na+-driven multidrug efflux pump